MTPTKHLHPSTGATAAATVCCGRPMRGIEVVDRGVSLVLRSCTACGQHVWERDGVLAGRAELLDGVRTFLEQPRLNTPRRRRA